MRCFNYRPILDSQYQGSNSRLQINQTGIHGVRPIPIHLLNLSLATYPSDRKSQLTPRRLKFLNSKST